MKRIALPWIVLLLPACALCQATAPLEITVLESKATDQQYSNPAGLVCLPSGACVAKGESTGVTRTIFVKARIKGSESGITLTCQIMKQSDVKHCMSLLPGDHPAKAKGKDALIVYGWPNPIYKGDMSKAQKLEFRVDGRALEQGELTPTP